MSQKKTFRNLSNTTNDYKRLYDFYDILCEIQCAKDNPHYSPVLAYFDSSTGVNQIVSRLPTNYRIGGHQRQSNSKDNTV